MLLWLFLLVVPVSAIVSDCCGVCVAVDAVVVLWSFVVAAVVVWRFLVAAFVSWMFYGGRGCFMAASGRSLDVSGLPCECLLFLFGCFERLRMPARRTQRFFSLDTRGTQKLPPSVRGPRSQKRY